MAEPSGEPSSTAPSPPTRSCSLALPHLRHGRPRPHSNHLRHCSRQARLALIRQPLFLPPLVQSSASSSAFSQLLKPRHIFALVGPGRTATISDAAAGRLYWAFTLVDSADPTVSSSRSSGGEEAREKILRAFEGWDAVTHLAQVTPPELILERRVLDLPPLPFWVKGRAALLGDAAHAVTPALGQGANLAFEDAAQLVECLRAHSGLSDALLAFQSIRMPRVQAVASQNIASSKKIYDGAEGGGRESDSSSKGIEAMPGESAGAATTGEPASAATPAEPAGAAASIAAGSVTGGKGGGGDGSDFYDYLYTFDTVSLTESAAGR
ncbi:hypothetical protein CLOP_g21371 [Closterium sp. NIES-67]|nr:hypothetical protein CLOP_g21371 [Closterium sp. NIES-67]